MGADRSRTCEGCRHVVEAQRPVKGSYHETVTAYRCFAPGPHRGYHIGTGRVLPYIPAWCPKNKKNRPPMVRTSRTGGRKAKSKYTLSIEG